MKKILFTMFLLITFIIIMNTPVIAAEGNYISVDISSGGLFLTPKVSHSKMVLTLSAPNGAVYTKTFTGGGSGYVTISELCKGNVLEGSYTFEATLYPFKNKLKRAELEENMKNGEISKIDRDLVEPMVIHGHFSVNNSSVTGGLSTALGDTGSDRDDGGNNADQVILDDLIVDGSICAGFDCVNGESFGFDTIRLKENNLRIRAVDTSNSASFPTNDWQITFNDSANGGANKFSIDDIDGGRTIFTLEAGAPSHSLYVDDGGRLGLGTSTPVVDVHLKSGNTPTLRLEQDGSSGFTPQTWDVAGNETNFFVRDATNGSKLPFRIRPNAPSNSIYVDSSGKVGMGTNSPSFELVIERSSANSRIVLGRTGTDPSEMQVSANGNRGYIGMRTSDSLYVITNQKPRLRITPGGNVGIGDIEATHLLELSGGAYSDGVTWENGSSRELKENIEQLSFEEAETTLRDLDPVKFKYKTIKDEKYVGFIAEDVPELVATKGRKGLGAMDIVAVLTKVVQEQQKSINELKKKIEKLENKK